MGEQTRTRLNHRSAACKFPSELVRKKQLLRPRRIKKSLNLRFRPNPILVAVSLALILWAIGLVTWWMLIGVAVIEANLDWIMAGEPLEILVLFQFVCFMWFQVTLVTGLIAGLNHLNLKPITIFVAVSLISLLISGLAYNSMLRIIPGAGVPEGVVPAVLLLIWFVGLTMLGAGWKLLSEIIEFNKTKTTSTPAIKGFKKFTAPKAKNTTTTTSPTEERGKLKNLKTAFLVVLLIVIGVAITPQFGETAGEDSSIMNLGEDSSIMNLEGRRIWIFGEGVPDPPVYTISADEYAHVYHGWNSKGQYDPKINWSELSEFEMNEFIGTSTFELTINGDPIELSCARWLDMEQDVYFVIYYIQFKPGDLATGNHTFSGTWYSEVHGNPYTDESGTCPITLNVTVNVV